MVQCGGLCQAITKSCSNVIYVYIWLLCLTSSSYVFRCKCLKSDDPDKEVQVVVAWLHWKKLLLSLDMSQSQDTKKDAEPQQQYIFTNAAECVQLQHFCQISKRIIFRDVLSDHVMLSYATVAIQALPVTGDASKDGFRSECLCLSVKQKERFQRGSPRGLAR